MITNRDLMFAISQLSLIISSMKINEGSVNEAKKLATHCALKIKKHDSEINAED